MKETRKKEAEAQSAALSRTKGVPSPKHTVGIPTHIKFSEQNPPSGENKERHSKRKRKPRQKQTSFNDSITGVNPIRTHGLGVYKSRRVVWGVRVDEKLLNEAKPVLTAKFGSHCRGVESWLAGLVATEKGKQLVGVNPSNTSIGTIVIERNLRSRRKLLVEETEITEKLSRTCGHVNCDADAVGSGLWRKKLTLPLCEEHFAEAKKLFWEWSDVKRLEAKP